MPHEGTYMQRGNACLNCRRRKQRCDGGRPACRQCIHYKRASECAYNDEKRLTRVQILESRLQQLEGLMLMQNSSQDEPLSPDRQGSSSSSHPGNNSSAYGSDFSIPKRIADNLLAVFFRHLYHYNFPLSIPRFRSIIDLPMTDARRPHPALLNAIFLLACQHSQDPDSIQYREAFIARADSYLEDEQSRLRRPLDFILAISLMAKSSLNAGDVHRAQALAGAAVSLAIHCNLHRISFATPISSNVLTPPANALELSERINLWWCVYMIDRDTSSESGVQSSIADEEITTPFPCVFTSYLRGGVRNTTTITSLYDRVPNNRAASIRGDVVLAVRVKATALLDRCGRLARDVAAHSIDVTSLAFVREFQAVELAITQFRQSLPTCISNPYPKGVIIDTETEDIYLCVQHPPGELGFLCHTVSMAHMYSLSAILQLHGIFSAASETHRTVVVRAAKEIANIVIEIDFVDSRRLHASVGTVIAMAIRVLIHDMNRPVKITPAPQLINLSYIDVLLPRLRSLAEIYPGVANHAQEIDDLLE